MLKLNSLNDDVLLIIIGQLSVNERVALEVSGVLVIGNNDRRYLFDQLFNNMKDFEFVVAPPSCQRAMHAVDKVLWRAGERLQSFQFKLDNGNDITFDVIKHSLSHNRQFISKLAKHFPNLTKFGEQFWAQDELTYITRYIKAILRQGQTPRLDAIELNAYCQYNRVTLPSFLISSCPQLHSLQLMSERSQVVRQVIETLPEQNVLKKLAISLHHEDEDVDDDEANFIAMVKKCPHLEELTIGYSIPIEFEPEPDIDRFRATLATCTKLATINLRVAIDDLPILIAITGSERIRSVELAVTEDGTDQNYIDLLNCHNITELNVIECQDDDQPIFDHLANLNNFPRLRKLELDLNRQGNPLQRLGELVPVRGHLVTEICMSVTDHRQALELIHTHCPSLSHLELNLIATELDENKINLQDIQLLIDLNERCDSIVLTVCSDSNYFEQLVQHFNQVR